MQLLFHLLLSVSVDANMEEVGLGELFEEAARLEGIGDEVSKFVPIQVIFHKLAFLCRGGRYNY
jgi:hypothetical protein